MKLLTTLIVSIFLCTQYGFAQTFVEQRKVYPVVISDGHRIVTGFQQFDSSDDIIFSNAMKWVIENTCLKGRDALFDIKTETKSFSFNLSLDYIINKKVKYNYCCSIDIKVADSKLLYTIYNINYKPNSFLPLSTDISLDKLDPEKKPKQQEIIDAFQRLYSNVLNQLFDAVILNKCKSISHWNDINIQRPVKGMNEDECKLAFGIPNNIFEDTNNRIQWSYGLNFVLIFKEEKLETIIR